MSVFIITILVCCAFMWLLHTRDYADERSDILRLLPVYKVEHNCIISKQGDITVAFRVTLPEIFTLSNDEYEALHQAWIKAVKLLPRHTVLHKQDWFVEDKFRACFSQEDITFLDRSSERFFNERPFLNHHCYLMLTRKAPGRKPSSSVMSNLLRRNMVPKETLDQRHYSEFMDIVGQFRRVLEDCGHVKLRQLTDEALTGSRLKAGILESYLYLQPEGSNPQEQDITFKPELRIGEKHLQLYTFSDPECLPSKCGSRINYDKYTTDQSRFSVGFAAPVGLLLDCNHIYNQFIVIDDAPLTMKKLESKRLRLQSLSGYSRENAIGRDAITGFLNEAIAEGRLPVKAHFNIQVWTDEESQLKELRNKTAAAITRMDGQPRQETLGAAQLFWAGMAGNEADLPINECFDTFAEQACCFLNLETNYRSSVSPIGVRLGDRLTGRPVNVDLSDEPMERGIITNRNKFILGPSGSGKSFFTNHMVRSYYEQGTHIVLVDVGHSYKGLCDLVGGYYFTYEEKNPIRFNPFYIGNGDFLDTEKKESIKTLLLALWKKDNEVFKRSEYVALSNAITLYFAYLDDHKEVFPCFNSFYEFLKAHFVPVLKNDRVKDRDFDIDNFLYVLRPYYTGGEFDYLLNATENLDLLGQRFIVFELDNIKDHAILLSVVSLIIAELFISKMRKLKGVRKMILIEEAWKAIAKDGMAAYIKYLFKTVRKFFGEAIVVTQEVDDIISSPVVKQAIINNSDCKILLDQSKYQNKFGQIQELLGLTEKEKTLIMSINKANDPAKKYKEVFIGLGNSLSRVYRTEVSPEEYLAYTTEESEKVRVQQYAKQYGSIRKGIAVLAAELSAKN